MKHLKEYIDVLVKEEFSMQQFRNIVRDTSNTKEILDYANSELEYINKGQARQVFALPNGERVLKIAYQSNRVTESDLGIRQNSKEVEISLYGDEGNRGSVTTVYEYDPQYKWIISERVRPIDPNSDEFSQETGVPEDIYYHGLERLYDDAGIDTGEQLIDSYMDTIPPQIEELRNNEVNASRLGYNRESIINARRRLESSIETYEELKNDKKAMKFLTNVIRLIKKHNLLIPDVARIEHWGKAKDGKIKLYDYGAEGE